MHSCSDQRDEASAHYFRQPEIEVPPSLLRLAPTEQPHFFFLFRLLEKSSYFSICVSLRKGIWYCCHGIYCFLDVLWTSPFLHKVVELSLFNWERVVMEQEQE